MRFCRRVGRALVQVLGLAVVVKCGDVQLGLLGPHNINDDDTPCMLHPHGPSHTTLHDAPPSLPYAHVSIVDISTPAVERKRVVVAMFIFSFFCTSSPATGMDVFKCM